MLGARTCALPAPDEPFVLDDLTIDYATRRVTVWGNTVELTSTEFDLVAALPIEAGRAVPTTDC